MKNLFLFLFLFSSLAHAIEVTVYNQDLGVIKEVRSFNLKDGVNQIEAQDVAARIDPTSVHFKSLTAPDSVSVLEQNFQYDLINQERLLEKYLGREIELERFSDNGDKRETIKGTLLSVHGGRVLKIGGKIYLNPPGNPVLAELPEGLISKPTLMWKVNAKKSGRNECEISYMTNGMNWSADYVAVVDAKDTQMDLNAWVTINNISGAAYPEAKVKLVAGEVHRAPQTEMMVGGHGKRYAMSAALSEPQFSEQSFFEYHLYTLQRPSTLQNNEIKQIEMASAVNVPLEKLFIYDGLADLYWEGYHEHYRNDPNFGTQSQKKVRVALEFKNSKANNMGMPLPAGRVRVYKKDNDGSLQFIGEDALDHTPKDEKITISMGNAFDIVGERKRVNYQSDVKGRWIEESYEIKLRNHKDEAVTVKVREHLYRWSGWKITQSSQKWEKENAQTAEFTVPVPKDGQAVVTYTVRYTW